jgi:drug/metabolite transporter (DMT)-like permease
MSRNLFLGLAAALLAALIGTGWQIASRHGVTTTLGPVELAVLRYCVPSAVLLPWLLRTGLFPAGVSRLNLLVLVAAGGLPFGMLVLAGAQFAPAAHIGIFMAGTMPLFTALAVWLVLGETVRGWRWAGFSLIGIGVLTLALSTLAGGAAASWRGDALFLLAAMLWAGYTLAFRRCGLTPWQGAAVVNAWSALALLALLPWLGAPLTAPWRDLLFQAVWQGVIAGLLGIVTYTAAVRRLGASRASLSAALVPPMTAAGAALLLGESLGWKTMLAALLVAAGVALASGAVLTRRVEKTAA